MLNRPATTVLLLTDTEVLRADFSSGANPALRGLWQRDRAVDGGLATAAELAMGLGKKIGRRVLVLTTSAWMQTISLPASSVEGMTDDELAQTLKFEVESFSGVAAFESDLAHRLNHRSGDNCEFWITQIERAELQVLEEVISARGAKLIGICHPAGLPMDVNGGGKRLEFWRQLICCVQQLPSPRLFVMHGNPRSDRWQVALGNWESQNGRTPTSQWLVAPGVAVAGENLGEDDNHVLRLEQREDIEPWLNGWASVANDSARCVPMLRPPRRPVSRRTKSVAAVAAASLVLAACVAHGYWIGQLKTSVAGEIATLEQRQTQKVALDKQLAEVEKSRKLVQEKLTAGRGQLHNIRSVATRQRGRFAILLERLTELRDEDLVIERIASDESGMTLTGLSLNPAAATHLAKALHAELTDVGWQVDPPTQTGRNQLANGGPWTFTIMLRDVPPSAVEGPGPDTNSGQNIAVRVGGIRHTSLRPVVEAAQP